MPSHLLLTRSGLLSTLQDRGRFGFQRYGISASGAMDMASLALANALVGNPPEMAAIEMTLIGLAATLEAGRCRLAVAGGEVQVTVNGRVQPGLTALDLEPGDKLDIGPLTTGMRAYLAVFGGFDIAATLGSLSTHTRSGIGGFEGRALAAGDRLPLRAPLPSGPRLTQPSPSLPLTKSTIRIILGPQDDMFAPAGIDTLLSSDYRMTQKTDRMGCVLDGPAIEHRDGYNIISDGIMNGSIQVPGHGRPVILLADRQTTGGYPKIATVIEPDLSRLAQCRPGETLRFERVTPEEAVAIAARYRSSLAALPQRLAPVVEGSHGLTTERLLSSNLISGVHHATQLTHPEGQSS
ncbi:biotin-dependent carboxylase-like uncharacterized protein [Rhodoligotrophos appendicifer]|uniref:5-oxoprolinase subunit C family protein n=1 Tax=Rhodoligotrophos appendicifer TaxID=987056 RepID=UPI001186600A|nr:biotin-dependent carboxyltransferase family protein [Rhodoligotrophos appendicifer]